MFSLTLWFWLRHRLRSQGLGPTEMRIGLNPVRITADAEREWQRRLQKPQRELRPGLPSVL